MAENGGLAKNRLLMERKSWRKNKPFGFHARPETQTNGTMDLMKWKCFIPGKQGTDWEGGYYPLLMEFSEDYPARPPKCKFDAGFFHPNVYPSGTVCLSILNEEEGWRPSITVPQVLMGIQDLLNTPNPLSPAQSDAYMMLQQQRRQYDVKVRQQAGRYPPPA